MLRPVLSMLIAIVLALLLAFASQFFFLPFMTTANARTLNPIRAIVFWLVFLGVMAYFAIVVRRGLHAAPDE